MKLLILLCALFLAISVAMHPPQKSEGYLYRKSPNMTVQIDVYADILCMNCHDFEPEFRKFLDTYQVQGRPVTDFVEVRFHVFPMPFHHNSFFISRLAPFVDSLKNENLTAVDFIAWGLSVQKRYQDEGAFDLNEPEILNNMCTDFSSEFAKGIVSFDSCMEAIHDRTFEVQARVSSAFGIYNGVVGTPTIFLNGVMIEALYKAEEWEDFIKEYLP